MIAVRPAQAADIPAIAALERLCFSSPWSARSLEALLAADTAVFLAAFCSGALCGYASANCLYETAYINNIAVDPAHRRRGAAAALLDALEEQAAARGAQDLTLEVRPSNLPAVSLYRARGFADIGQRSGFYENPREDALLMRKRICAR